MTFPPKSLSNAASTGGAGTHFEAHVQATLVTLMITGGHAPCLPSWPISEIKLQGKVEGFDTDDLIVFVRDRNTRNVRKLLAQIKRTISFTKNNLLGEVVQAAWNDFNDSTIFDPDRDKIALITSHLNATDASNVLWLLDQAKHTNSAAEFFSRVSKAKFSPPKAEEKLKVLRHHLRIANDGIAISDDELYSFLQAFYLIGYDLGREAGVVLSLLCSHISQFDIDLPEWAWSRIVEVVQCWNQNAGTITLDRLPDDIKDAFKEHKSVSIPQDYVAPESPPLEVDWNKSAHANALAVALLIGEWDESNKADLELISRLNNEF